MAFGYTCVCANSFLYILSYMKTRPDHIGFFWEVPAKVNPRKATPPDRTWEDANYLPYLTEAKAFNVSLFTIPELIAAQQANEILLCDVEIYFNYFLVAFASLASGKVIYFESPSFDIPRLKWVLENFQIVTFNGKDFDIPIITLALEGLSTEQLKHAANQMILQQVKPWIILRQHKARIPQINHIDLIEVAPLTASLKIYGGRLHVPKMQELPFKESLTLTPDQMACVRWYCINSDLTATAFLYMELLPQLDLRRSMSIRYQTDLRSKSDAQIAEAVIVAELRRVTGQEPTRPEIAPGTVFKYRVPAYVRFETATLQGVLDVVAGADFVINEHGSPMLPKEINELQIRIAQATYQMGLGGLHSSETCTATYADDSHILVDRDVTSYYPAIILNQGLFPSHLGTGFLTVYQTLVERRIKAKKEKNKVEAETLKITVNGSFGKLGSKWSCLYAPDLMLQVTISGQLSLLMLIERLEAAEIPIASANTDGLLIRCPKDLVNKMGRIVAAWEQDTGFKTEETAYCAVFARDVNNYVAVKLNGGKPKVKGCYAERGSSGDSVLSKNPVNLICLDALLTFLTTGIPIASTVRGCQDIRRFVSVRTVKGGAVKDGAYLGKAIRWYQSNAVEGEIIYASNGNKVPGTERCQPCMELPTTFPTDVDFTRYEEQTLEMLREIGYR